MTIFIIISFLKNQTFFICPYSFFLFPTIPNFKVGISLESVNMDMLGRSDRIVVGKDQTTIVTGSDNKDAIEKRIAQIRAEVDATENKFDKEKGLERVAALGGGIARIKVGAATETELKDKKLRYEDALNSVKSALEMVNYNNFFLKKKTYIFFIL